MKEQPTVVIEPIEDMLKKLNVSAAFGEPVREGNTVVIPVASVTYGFGYGAGYGRGPAQPDEESSPPDEGEGGGGGGGAGGMAKPQGYIRIGEDGVHYEPIVDPTRISLAGIFMVAWNVFWIARAVKAFAGKSCC